MYHCCIHELKPNFLVVVVVAFFLCWIPFHSQRLLFVVVTLFGNWTSSLQQVQHILFMISGVAYYFNSILNPILYSILSKRFRRGFNDITVSCCVYKVYNLPYNISKFLILTSRHISSTHQDDRMTSQVMNLLSSIW